jgi:hypothetical protein
VSGRLDQHLTRLSYQAGPLKAATHQACSRALELTAVF